MSRTTAPLLLALAVIGASPVAEAGRGDHCARRGGCEEPPAACPTVTTVFDIEVPSVMVRGTFTINGAAPPIFDAESGRIELRSSTLGVVDLGATWEGSFLKHIVPGTYDVVYVHESGTALPANAETVLYPEVAFTKTGIWDIDIPRVRVTGTITLGGAPPPGGFYENGEIRLRDVDTGASFVVGYSRDGSYTAPVVPGVYDVLWSRLAGGDVVPSNGGAVLVEGVLVDGPTVIDVDVPFIDLVGTFKIGGATPPTGFYENGEVLLRDNTTGDTFAIGQTRDRTWSARVLPGTYDVLYARLLGGDVVPANTLAVVKDDVVLRASGSLAIDVPVVSLAGDFTLDGDTFPDSFYNHGHLWLHGIEPGDLVDLGSSLDRSYAIKVVPGTYDVVYEGRASTGSVPANSWATVSVGAKLPKGKGTRVLDIDVSSAFAGVDVTIWGAAPPAGFYDNGVIEVVGPDGDAVEVCETRDGGGSVRVVAGSYDLHYGHLIGDLPINGDARVGSTDVHDLYLPAAVDLRPGLLAGVFSQDGAPFPASGASGRLALRDVQTDDRVGIGSTTAGMYDEVVLGGTYDVLYDHVSGGGIVANVGANLGCFTFAPAAP